MSTSSQGRTQKQKAPGRFPRLDKKTKGGNFGCSRLFGLKIRYTYGHTYSTVHHQQNLQIELFIIVNYSTAARSNQASYYKIPESHLREGARAAGGMDLSTNLLRHAVGGHYCPPPAIVTERCAFQNATWTLNNSCTSRPPEVGITTLACASVGDVGK